MNRLVPIIAVALTLACGQTEIESPFPSLYRDDANLDGSPNAVDSPVRFRASWKGRCEGSDGPFPCNPEAFEVSVDCDGCTLGHTVCLEDGCVQRDAAGVVFDDEAHLILSKSEPGSTQLDFTLTNVESGESELIQVGNLNFRVPDRVVQTCEFGNASGATERSCEEIMSLTAGNDYVLLHAEYYDGEQRLRLEPQERFVGLEDVDSTHDADDPFAEYCTTSFSKVTCAIGVDQPGELQLTLEGKLNAVFSVRLE